MLVNLYRSKTPLSIFTLPLVIGIVCISIFLKPTELNTYFFSWQTVLFGEIQSSKVLHFFLTGALISLNAHQLNNVFNRNTFYSKDSFLPGFIYVIGLTTLNCIEFSPLLIAHLFLIGALAAFLQMKRQEPAKNQVFIGSFLISLAIIFSPVMISLVLLPWISLLIIRPFIWRDWFIALIGLAIPVLYHYALNFVVSGKFAIQRMDLLLDVPDVEWTMMQSAVYGTMLLCILVASFGFFGVMRNQVVSFKKISQVLLVTAILCTISFFVGWYAFDQFYTSFLVPVSCVTAIQLLYTSRVQLSAAIVNIWFLLAVINLFLSA